MQRDVNEDTVRAIVEEINDKFNEKEIEQRLAYVHFEWDEMVGDFLVLCNTLATVGYVDVFSVLLLLSIYKEGNRFYNQITFRSSSPVYNEVECNYMKSLIECIVTNPTHHIAMMTAIHLTSVTAQASQSQSTSKRLTKQRAEELLADWIIAGYFVQVNYGDSLTLGPRCIGEFRDTLLTTFPDSIRSCKLCSEICLKVKFIQSILTIIFEVRITKITRKKAEIM